VEKGKGMVVRARVLEALSLLGQARSDLYLVGAVLEPGDPFILKLGELAMDIDIIHDKLKDAWLERLLAEVPQVTA
jgi:hypothetical protein